MSIESVFQKSVSEFKSEMSNSKLHNAFVEANRFMRVSLSRYSSAKEYADVEKTSFDIIRKALTDEQVAPCFKAEKMGWSIHACLGNTLVMWNSSNRGRMHISPDGSWKRES